MSVQQTQGKEQEKPQAARERAETAEQLPTWATSADPSAAWQRASDPAASVRPNDLLSLQKTVGNHSVQRLIARRKEEGCCGDNTDELEPLAAPSPAGDAPRLLQRHGEDGVPEATVAAPPTPSALAATPGETTTVTSAEGVPSAPIPPEIIQNHGTAVAAGNHQEALNLIYNHMVTSGQIDGNLMQTAVNDNGRALCSTDQLFRFENVDGAFTHYCTPITSGATQLPNPRIKINQSMVANAMNLHSTLLHEFRHVQQQHSLINNRSASPGGSSDCLYCNNPDETDAYLAEIERGHYPGPMRRAFARVYVNWDYLAPEQRAVFQSRRDTAEAHFDSLYPGINWDANAQVIAYRQWCENNITNFENAHNISRPFYCNRAIAPLTPGRQSGQPRAEGESGEGSGSEDRIPTDAGGPTGAAAAPAEGEQTPAPAAESEAEETAPGASS